MKNWRRVLSNMHIKKDEAGNVVPLFKLDGKNWASVEHYYHANKFKKNNPDFYNVFSMDSKSVICKDPKMALGAGGKTGKRQKDPETKKSKIVFRRPKNVVMDEDFFDDGNNEKVMEKVNKQNMKMKIMKWSVMCYWQQRMQNYYIIWLVVLRRKIDLLQLYFMILCV